MHSLHPGVGDDEVLLEFGSWQMGGACLALHAHRLQPTSPFEFLTPAARHLATANGRQLRLHRPSSSAWKFGPASDISAWLEGPEARCPKALKQSAALTFGYFWAIQLLGMAHCNRHLLLRYQKPTAVSGWMILLNPAQENAYKCKAYVTARVAFEWDGSWKPESNQSNMRHHFNPRKATIVTCDWWFETCWNHLKK